MAARSGQAQKLLTDATVANDEQRAGGGLSQPRLHVVSVAANGGAGGSAEGAETDMAVSANGPDDAKLKHTSCYRLRQCGGGSAQELATGGAGTEERTAECTAAMEIPTGATSGRQSDTGTLVYYRGLQEEQPGYRSCRT